MQLTDTLQDFWVLSSELSNSDCSWGGDAKLMNEASDQTILLVKEALKSNSWKNGSEDLQAAHLQTATDGSD